MMKVAVLIVVLVIAVGAQYEENNYPRPFQTHQVLQEEEHLDYHDEPNYKYEYKVDDHKTGDFKGHAETREGDTVKGFYMLREADGTMREVHYTADKNNGFNAVVKKIGTPTIAPEQVLEPIKKAYHPIQFNQAFHEPSRYELEFDENNKYAESQPSRQLYHQ